MIVRFPSLMRSSLYIYVYIGNMLCGFSMFGMDSAYNQMPEVSITIASSSATSGSPSCIPPCANNQSVRHQQPRIVTTLYSSVSHGNFQQLQSEGGKNNATHEDLKQVHENFLQTSITKPIAKESRSAWFARKLTWPVRLLTLVGVGMCLYMQMRIINTAEQIAANTSRLDSIGDQIDANTAQIAGGVVVFDNIMELLLNLTRKG